MLQILGIVIGIPFLIIFHEAGHMVFGFASGYKLTMFKFGPFEIRKSNKGKYKIFKGAFNINILGQCLMSPPKVKKKKNAPFFLYNAGGLIFSYVFLFASIIIFLFSIRYIKWFFMPIIIINLFLCINNTMYSSTGINDVSNGIFIKNNPKYLETILYQLEVTSNIYNDKRFGTKTFYDCFYEGKLNHISLPAVQFKFYYAIDHDDLEQALRLGNILNDNYYNIILPIQRVAIIFDIMWCDIVIKRNMHLFKMHFRRIKGLELKMCKIENTDVNCFYKIYKSIYDGENDISGYIEDLKINLEMHEGEAKSLEKRLAYLNESIRGENDEPTSI